LSLLNAGVEPLVLATLASTAEREFLAMVKIGRDGREIGMDRRDMLDLVQLDRRTDRILPNGY
jgi:hypothetical protein